LVENSRRKNQAVTESPRKISGSSSEKMREGIGGGGGGGANRKANLVTMGKLPPPMTLERRIKSVLLKFRKEKGGGVRGQVAELGQLGGNKGEESKRQPPTPPHLSWGEGKGRRTKKRKNTQRKKQSIRGGVHLSMTTTDGRKIEPLRKEEVSWKKGQPTGKNCCPKGSRQRLRN